MASAILEGEGVLRDFNGSTDGKPVFETQDINKWNEHCKEAGLTKSGVGPCVICSDSVEFSNLSVGKNPVCGSCKEDLV